MIFFIASFPLTEKWLFYCQLLIPHDRQVTLRFYIFINTSFAAWRMSLVVWGFRGDQGRRAPSL